MATDATEAGGFDPADDDDRCGCHQDDCPECDRWCHTCGGEGWGFRGESWANDDPVNDPDGECERCPNCRGSGLAKDCWYW